MNLGRSIVGTILRTGKIDDFLAVGMDDAWLRTPESHAVFGINDREPYRFLLSHWGEHGTVNRELFEQSFPRAAYRLTERDQRYKPAELLDQARKAVQRHLLLEILNEVTDMEDELDDAVALVRDRADRLAYGVLSRQEGDAVLLSDFDFNTFVTTHIQPWIPLGIAEVDEAFGTFQPGQLITLVGRQKSTKSTLMAWSAIAAWQEGFTNLFYNVELDMHFLRQKMMSIGAHTSPERLRRGPVGREQKKIWAQELERLEAFHAKLIGDKDSVPFWVSQKYSAFTVKDVRADIARYDPHAVYIDGFYFMVDSNGDSASTDWRAIEHLAAELKALAMETGTTIIISTQSQEKQQGAKKKPGIEARTIQGGTGLLKASDLVLGLDIDEMGVVYVNDVRNRHGHLDTMKVTWDWEDMTMAVAEYIDYEALRDGQRDTYVEELGA